MRKVVIMLLAASPFIASADAVRWGGATITNGEAYNSSTFEYVDGAEIIYSGPKDYNDWDSVAYYLQGYFGVSDSGDKTVIKGIGHALSGACVFVKMEIGEVVSALTTLYSDEVFYQYGYVPGMEEIPENHRDGGDYDIEVSNYGTQVFHLGFWVEGGTRTEIIPLYGWLEVAVNGTELSIVNSAIGLNGQSMVVGVIPEPSCTFLMLTGIAVLALRRQRR